MLPRAARAYRAARDVLLRRGGWSPRDAARDAAGTVRYAGYHPRRVRARPANPAEARLADLPPCACVHVRPRLGVHHAGTQRREPFSPPSVYYRVYTHHPVDLNALAGGVLRGRQGRRGVRARVPRRLERAREEPRRISDANANASHVDTCVSRNDWRPLPARAARALVEDERVGGGGAQGPRPSGFLILGRRAHRRPRRRRVAKARAFFQKRAGGGGARTSSSTPSAASGGSQLVAYCARRSTKAACGGRGGDARRDPTPRARAWSAGGDGSACGSTEYNSEYDSAGEDEELDSPQLEWSARD